MSAETVCSSVRDGTHDTPAYVSEGVPLITSKNLLPTGLDFENTKSISEDDHFEISKRSGVNEGDVLFAMIGTVGNPVVVGTDRKFSIKNVGLFKKNPTVILPRFLKHWLACPQFKAWLEPKQKGTTQKFVPLGLLRAIPVPLAPLSEQHSIVAEIEKQFTRLDAGVTSLERVQVALNRYRASVLKAACEGRLVPTEAELARAEERPYEHARSLLESVLPERLDSSKNARKQNGFLTPEGSLPVSVPEGWWLCSIDEAAECLDSKRVPVNKTERARRIGDVPYYGANGQVGWIDNYIFDEPLVLVVEDETFTGRTQAFSYLIHGKSWVNNHAHVLRPSRAVDPQFLNYSLAYYPFTPRTTGSTGRRKLTQKGLMTAPFLLPPFAEQKRIVAEVERRLSVVEELEMTMIANLKRAERLRQSFLQRAFSGKLLPFTEKAEKATPSPK